jgi:hypothetical protein
VPNESTECSSLNGQGYHTTFYPGSAGGLLTFPMCCRVLPPRLPTVGGSRWFPFSTKISESHRVAPEGGLARATWFERGALNC